MTFGAERRARPTWDSGGETMMAALYPHSDDLAPPQVKRSVRVRCPAAAQRQAAAGEIGRLQAKYRALRRLIHGGRGRLALEGAMPGMKITVDAAMREIGRAHV